METIWIHHIYNFLVKTNKYFKDVYTCTLNCDDTNIGSKIVLMTKIYKYNIIWYKYVGGIYEKMLT